MSDPRADGAPPVTPPLAIDVRGLVKRFGHRTVVDGLSLQVPRGRICGFLGPNGSGKTTTIRMVCGLLAPDGGEGTCVGYDIRTQAFEIKRRVGYMTQRFGLYEDLSIEENLAFIARVYEVPQARAAVAQALERLGLAARRKQLAGELSGGWKQRLALAACLLHQPQVLLLDEPTAGVDPKARRDFWQELHALAADGMTVLVSTHYMDEAERCHQIAYIVYGRLLAAGTAEQVLSQSGLAAWEVTGTDLPGLIRLLEQAPQWMAAPFGAAVHVTSDTNEDFAQWLATHDGDGRWQVRPIKPGLEDLFISLMRGARDNFADTAR